MRILAIESSCDETAAAVVEDGVTVISNVVATSHEMHEKYGGIVPEVAARKQLESIIPVATEALKPLQKNNESVHQIINDSIDAIAVTVGPGLIASLLVGVETAKTISMTTGKHLIPVNHVLAHMYANFVNDAPVIASKNEAIPSGSPRSARDDKSIEFPAISLVVSGGHTELYLMESPKKLTWLGGTIDDAAGECFDKSARLLGFGHGGGLAIQDAAKKYNVNDQKYIPVLPRPMLEKDNELNFSFSGLKTAILREVNKLKERELADDEHIAFLSYDIQEAITDVLVKKTMRAIKKYETKSVLLSGGVSSNLRLREKLSTALRQSDLSLSLHVPPVPLCTDNAVYIASYAYFRGKHVPWQTITAVPDLSVESV